MTWDEVVDLLTLAAAFDSRTVGEADVTAWLAALGDLQFGPCRDAVVRHYREHDRRVMPSHVRALARSSGDMGRRIDRGLVQCPECTCVHGASEPCTVLVADASRWRKALASGRSLRAALEAPVSVPVPPVDLEVPLTLDAAAAEAMEAERARQLAALGDVEGGAS